MEVGLSPGDLVVLDGDRAPSPKRGWSPLPNFWQIFTAPKRLDASQCHLVWRYRPQPRGLFVRRGPSHPSPKGGGAPPQFSAHTYCGQTAGWVKMALGMELGLGPSHIVLDGAPTPLPQEGGRPPIFGQFFSVTKLPDASRCHLVWS